MGRQLPDGGLRPQCDTGPDQGDPRRGTSHIKVIYFNDPVLIREGLTRWYTGHDDHVHVRFCERVYPLATYDC